MAGVTKEMNFKFYFILLILNLNSHMRLVTTILSSAVLEHTELFPF